MISQSKVNRAEVLVLGYSVNQVFYVRKHVYVELGKAVNNNRMTNLFFSPYFTTRTCALQGDLAGSIISASNRAALQI